MCVISGYIGSEQAAPVLLEMLQREEGLAGGFYTGIATLHEGRLYYEKVVGDVEALIKETNALQLPGTIGIAHSRTPSGGGRDWAHPFVDVTGQLAYIANGARGLYAETTDLSGAAHSLFEAGHQFLSAQMEPVDTYPVLPNGMTAHSSDIMCQAIAEAYKQQPQSSANRLLQAAVEVYGKYPAEIVGLCLHAEHPDEIVVMRHNKPMEIGRGVRCAVYLASATVAFPESVNWQMRVPPQAGMLCHRDGSMRVVPFEGDFISFGSMPSPLAIEKTLCGLLREKPCNMIDDLLKAAAPLWPEGTITEKEIVVFEMLASLLVEGRIELKNKMIPGMFNCGMVPETWVYWRHENSHHESAHLAELLSTQ